MQRFKEVVCADGFSMSVQASETHYCSPREDGAEKYTAVEVGYPNPPEPQFIPLPRIAILKLLLKHLGGRE